jgi:hypothetical protein
MAALSPLLAQGNMTDTAIGGRKYRAREPPHQYVSPVRFVPTLTTVTQSVVPPGLLGNGLSIVSTSHAAVSIVLVP